jgi:hypothetical protein
MRPLVGGTDDFKIQTDIKIASDVVLGAGVDPIGGVSVFLNFLYEKAITGLRK